MDQGIMNCINRYSLLFLGFYFRVNSIISSIIPDNPNIKQTLLTICVKPNNDIDSASIFIKEIESLCFFVFTAILRLYAADTAVENMASIKRI